MFARRDVYLFYVSALTTVAVTGLLVWKERPNPHQRLLLVLLLLAFSVILVTNLQVDLHLPDTLPELPSSHRLALYRAVQEALTNVQRHAKAQHVGVSLVEDKGRLVLRVRDDGQGLPEDADKRGFGLRGLRERAFHLNGTLRIAPISPHGTELVFEIPLSN